jgi:spermidine/putrescine-binding protein
MRKTLPALMLLAGLLFAGSLTDAAQHSVVNVYNWSYYIDPQV